MKLLPILILAVRLTTLKTQHFKTGATGFVGYLTRCDLFRGTGLLTLAVLVAFFGIVGCGKAPFFKKPRLSYPTYESIGVKPVINCADYTTNFSGCLMPPEVKMAMGEASKNFVLMQELIDAVGRRLGELTGAEWGCVSSGCSACLIAATLACVCGMDLEKIPMPPDLTGLKNECVVQTIHRNNFDHAIEIVGVKMIEIDTLEEMKAAINERTAMIFVTGGILDSDESLALEDMVRIGKKHGIPVLVDAAMEGFDCPNFYIKAGVDLVAYSGGKSLEGPQPTGILLGRKDLCQAAARNMAPYWRGFGRAMKVGKEEYMGVLAAAELWVKRDHDAEWKERERMLNYIAKKLEGLPTVTTELDMRQGLRARRYPILRFNWDQNVIKITQNELRQKLLDGKPRIITHPGRIISPTMETGQEVIVAQRIYEILSGSL